LAPLIRTVTTSAPMKWRAGKLAVENGTYEWYTRLTGMAQNPLILLNF